jgi:serine/threonine protein kinase
LRLGFSYRFRGEVDGFSVAFTYWETMKELSLQNCRIDGRYDIQSELGRGSYAEIYVARDVLASPQSPHSVVVIKALNVFLQDDLDDDLEQTLVENFQNEAIALDRVRHPNVINRLGHGTARDLRGTVFHYLVLEYLPGGDLSKLRSNHGLTVDQAFSYLEQTCAGLAHAHQSGIIHRDIKPQNLLLTEDRKIVKIADFGVARLTQNDSPITRVGTNMYAPPEHSPIFTDSMNVMVVTELTPAADIYSLAKTAYVLITGDSPRKFSNFPVNELPLSFAGKHWGGELLRVLRKATQNQPSERFQSVNEFWEHLAEIKVLFDSEESEPMTQISAQPHRIPQASVSKDYSPLAPVQPTFKTSDDFKVPMTEEKNPNFVVRISDRQVNQNVVLPPILNDKNQIHFEIPQPPPKKKRLFLKKAAIFLISMILFAGALFATQNYLRSGRILPKITNPFVKPEGKAIINVNIRSEGNAKSPKIGLVPQGSRVRILNKSKDDKSKDVWFEIEVIERTRDKENPLEADRGWVNGDYIEESL